MITATSTTAVGVFSNRDDAESAISALHRAGFGTEEIGVVSRNSQGTAAATNRNINTEVDDTEDDAEDAAGGAAVGAAAGVGIGALIGAGVLAGVIPVIGPALFAGTLGVLASNAAGGAAVAGLVGAFVGWGVPKEDAEFYESEVSAGRTVVTVTSDRFEEARSILQNHGGTSRTSVSICSDNMPCN